MTVPTWPVAPTTPRRIPVAAHSAELTGAPRRRDGHRPTASCSPADGGRRAAGVSTSPRGHRSTGLQRPRPPATVSPTGRAPRRTAFSRRGGRRLIRRRRCGGIPRCLALVDRLAACILGLAVMGLAHPRSPHLPAPRALRVGEVRGTRATRRCA